MIKKKQSEIRWIVRGMLLGRSLKCCARMVRRQLNRFRRKVDMEVAGALGQRASTRRAPPVDTPPVDRNASRKRAEELGS